MKVLVFISISAWVALVGCNNSEREAIREAIPGTYIRSSVHEFGTEHDTLIISLQNTTTTVYKIVRRWKYERILDGQAIEPEYKITTTTAIFDVETAILHDMQTGNVYAFDANQNTMLVGSTKYQKHNK